MLTNQTTAQQCPCGTGKPFAFCCEPLIEGAKAASSAEQLMRSRYSAFVMGTIDYLIDTTVEQKRHLIDASILAEQVKLTNWLGLTILDRQAGTAADQQGCVEFEATFEANGEHSVLHERSNFVRQQDRWFYVDGDVTIKPAT